MAARGAQIPDMPKPRSAIGSRMCQASASAVIASASHSTATVVTANPSPVSNRGCTRSVNRPTMGAITIDTAAIGTMQQRGLGRACSPRTSCAHSISGKPIAVAVNDIVEMATDEIEKLRSENRLSGTSGSRRFFACQGRRARARPARR